MVWQLVTYMFLHNPLSIWHILFNLLALWMFGRDVENDLGPLNFLKLYFLGGILGGLAWLAFNLNSPNHVLGASGAVLAICIAYATLYPERPITMLIFFILPLTMKAKYWAWLTVVLVGYGCLVTSGGGVADLAHLGGILVGYLYVKWLGFGQTPVWMLALRRVVPQSHPRRRIPDEDEFHSSRPGVAYNHPYRTFEEEQTQSAPQKKGVFGKLFAPRTPVAEEEMDKDEYIQKEVDPILDKIAKQGIQSLTKRERQILESAREKIDKRR
jgi:hypothetical protein